MLATFQWLESSPSAASGAGASSAAVTGTDPSSVAGILSSSNLDEALSLLVIGELTEVSGGTLDVYLQTFLLGHWYDLVHFKQLASGTTAFVYAFPLGQAGTDNGGSIVIGVDNVPALAADKSLGGPWGEKFRLWMVPGVGAPAGVSNVKVTMVAQLPRGWGR